MTSLFHTGVRIGWISPLGFETWMRMMLMLMLSPTPSQRVWEWLFRNGMTCMMSCWDDVVVFVIITKNIIVVVVDVFLSFQGVFYKMNGSLFFAKVDESHAGSYTCTPYNDLGTDGPSPVINVIVLRPPIFTITPKAIYIQKLGESAQMLCQAIDRDGSNHPSIDWKRVSAPSTIRHPLGQTPQPPDTTTINIECEI